MNCLICDNQAFKVKFSYTEPDKYEEWMGIQDVSRFWACCTRCGFYQSSRNYEFDRLEKIYRKCYRDPLFRNENMWEAYNRIMGLSDSENDCRVKWFMSRTDKGCVLDIGSGLGVFPARLKRADYDVDCVEENEDSFDFINNDLDIPCYFHAPDKKYDVVSAIHLLEHIEDPDGFVRSLSKRIKSAGRLFIEVPDSKEFDLLPQDHDEFNSCHVAMYDISALCKVVERNKFRVTDIQRAYYPKRGLSRILMLARPTG